MKKPALKLDTGGGAFFPLSHARESQLLSPGSDDIQLEKGHQFLSDRSRRGRIKTWLHGLARGGSSRRITVLVLIGLLWLVLYFYKHQVSQTTSLRAYANGQLHISRLNYRTSSVSRAPGIIGKRDIDISSRALPLEASLRERLDIWRDAPGGRGDISGEVEPGQFMQWNLEVSRVNTIARAKN